MKIEKVDYDVLMTYLDGINRAFTHAAYCQNRNESPAVAIDAGQNMLELLKDYIVTNSEIEDDQPKKQYQPLVETPSEYALRDLTAKEQLEQRQRIDDMQEKNLKNQNA